MMEVVDNRELVPRIFQMKLMAPGVAKTAAPGQFLHIRCSHSISPLLRRPISIAGVGEDLETVEIIYRVVGEGTQWLSRRASGEELDVLGPLGKGFPMPKPEANPVLVGGGLGVAPLLFLAQEIAKNRGTTKSPGRVFIGFCTAAEAYGIDRLKTWGYDVFVATDDGSLGHRGFPTDPLTSGLGADDVLYTCGPLPLISKVKALGRRYSIPTYLSLEERMACGIGACIGCSVKASGDGYKKVCKDGPVFEADKVILDGEERL